MQKADVRSIKSVTPENDLLAVIAHSVIKEICNAQIDYINVYEKQFGIPEVKISPGPIIIRSAESSDSCTPRASDGSGSSQTRTALLV